jgi:hypothetical protein
MGLRFAGALLGAASAELIAGSWQSDSAGEGFVGLGVGAIALGMIAVGTADSLADAPLAAGEYNATHRQLGIAPIASPHAQGLALVGTF